MPTKAQRENLQAWTAALRSGNYTQIQGKLRSDDGYCCLGVLCEIVSPELWDYDAESEEPFMHWGRIDSPANDILDKVGLINSDTYDLIALNDDDKLSFPEIADFIDENY